MKCTHKALRTRIQYVRYIYLGTESTHLASCKSEKKNISAGGSLILGASVTSQRVSCFKVNNAYHPAEIMLCSPLKADVFFLDLELQK